MENKDTEALSDTSGRHFLQSKNLRQGETGMGRPNITPRPCEQQPDDTGEEQLGENNDFSVPTCEITFFDRIQKIVSPILILPGTFLGIYLFGNLVSFWRQFCTFVWWEKICFGIPMAFFAGIIFYMLYRLACLWIKLQTFTQISGKALNELQERGELRELSRRRNQEARSKLEELLRDTAIQDEFIKQVSPKMSGDIRNARDILLDEHCSAKEWIDRYLKNYQSKLDEVAKERINHYSWQAALAATTSPFPALDQLIVLATCVTLLKELFQIYNLRPKWDKNFLLMARIVIHVYVSGFWQQLAGTGADAVGKGIEDFVDSVKTTNTEGVMTKGLGALGSLAPGVGKFIAKGVAEFAMHKITVSRFGAAAIRVLQPVGK
ncbi:MAG: DUF697 domain-containing protein [Kiritimatiellae bacterium]|nr:DUF697 domain-containing protein [Kiritimatiellia bacterium]